MQILKKVLLHLFAVALPLLVAFVLINLFHVDNSVIQGLIGLACIAVEKFIRENNSIPIDDWVNK